MFGFQFESEYHFHFNLHITGLLPATAILQKLTGNTFNWNESSGDLTFCHRTHNLLKYQRPFPTSSEGPQATHLSPHYTFPGVFVTVRADCSAMRTTSYCCPHLLFSQSLKQCIWWCLKCTHPWP